MQYYQLGRDKPHGVVRWAGGVSIPEYWSPKTGGVWVADPYFYSEIGLKGPMDDSKMLTEGEAKEVLASLGKTDGLA